VILFRGLLLGVMLVVVLGGVNGGDGGGGRKETHELLRVRHSLISFSLGRWR